MNNTNNLPKNLEAQAKQLVFVAKQMQDAARMLKQIQPSSRLSHEGREAISRAAHKRWARVRSEKRRVVKARKPAKASKSARVRNSVTKTRAPKVQVRVDATTSSPSI